MFLALLTIQAGALIIALFSFRMLSEAQQTEREERYGFQHDNYTAAALKILSFVALICAAYLTGVVVMTSLIWRIYGR